MSGVRYDRILASTALALIFAAPIGEARSQDVRITAQVTAVASVPVPSTDRTALAADEMKPAIEDDNSTAVKPAAETPAATPSPAREQAAKTPAEATPAAPSDSAVATAPAVEVDPLASLDPADRPIAEKIRDLLGAKSDRIFATKKERAAVEAFYQARNLAPLWFDKGVEAARTGTVAAHLRNADAEGLDADDYKIPNLANLADADAQAEAELKLTQVVLTYARHVQAGRFPYTRVSSNIELPQAPPEAGDVLSKIADAQDAARALDEFSPPHAAYQKLKAALAELRAKSHGGHKQIAEGPLLKFVSKNPMEDARVPMLRERLGVAGDSSDLKYDAKLAEAVKQFQKANGLSDDGALGSRTLEALNGPAKSEKIDIILANMERWRWFPRDLGKAYSMVNQPDFTLKVVKEGSTLWTTRIVIGSPDKATPLLTETMKYITVNPTWNVPPSIVHNEYLPALQQDPTVLARMGLRVTYNRDGSVHISQPPGEKNALGQIRFNFPNRFLVYQHDTNEKHYFSRDVRAYSHGCMRVQDPAKYAEVILGLALPEEGYTAERIKKMYGTRETDIKFATPIPVHLTYQSAFVDDDGKLQFRRDVYGLDSRTIAALKGERAVVYAQNERPKDTSSGSSSRRAQPRTVSFFEALFGGGFRQRR
ncbi:MAG: L,D-transpeptidase family protein [Xanthobacteraceae bacterium]